MRIPVILPTLNPYRNQPFSRKTLLIFLNNPTIALSFCFSLKALLTKHAPLLLFFESADTEAPLVLPPEAVHHAMRVLRMRQGDAVEVFNGKGCAVKGTIRFATDFAEVIPQEVIMQPRGLKLVLMQALVANEKMDWIIEKACELGYAEIAVFPSERGEVRLTCEKQ